MVDQPSEDLKAELSKKQKAKIESFGEELKRKRSPAPVSLQITELHHKNDHVTRHIERSLINNKEYKVDKKANQLVHQHQFEAPRNRGIGEMKFIIEGLAEQAHETITVALD